MTQTFSPFPLDPLAPEEELCPRPLLTDAIVNAVKDNQHVLVYGLPGMGKTTLLHQTLSRLKDVKRRKCYYVNLNNTLNEEEFLIRLADKTLGRKEGDQLKLMRELTGSFTHLRSSIRHDPFLASPSISFNIDEGFQLETTLDQFFTYWERAEDRILIVLDDFQQLLSYREGSTVEPLLRKFASRSSNVTLIVSFDRCMQSGRLLMKDTEGGDFYSRLPHVIVDSIGQEQFAEYICRQFTDEKRKISTDLADQIIEWCRYRTGNVQFVCNRLFQTGARQPDDWFVERVFQRVLDECEGVFYNYRTLLAANQWILLRGIAREKGARQVMGSGFIRKNDLGSPSSVQTALLALQEKRMVYEEEGCWFVSDVFLSRWLER